MSGPAILQCAIVIGLFWLIVSGLLAALMPWHALDTAERRDAIGFCVSGPIGIVRLLLDGETL